MVRPIVPFHQILQDGYKVQGVLHGKVSVQALFQGPIESFYDTGFGVTAGRKMMNAFMFHQGLKGFIVKFLPIIRLKIDRFSSSTPFQDLFESIRYGLSRLVLHGLNPGLLRKNIHHSQEITIPSIVLGNADHFNQIRCPLLINTKHNHR